MAIDITPKTILLAVGIGMISEGARWLEVQNELLKGVVLVLMGLVVLYFREHLKLNGVTKEKEDTENNHVPHLSSE